MVLAGDKTAMMRSRVKEHLRSMVRADSNVVLIVDTILSLCVSHTELLSVRVYQVYHTMPAWLVLTTHELWVGADPWSMVSMEYIVFIEIDIYQCIWHSVVYNVIVYCMTAVPHQFLSLNLFTVSSVLTYCLLIPAWLNSSIEEFHGSYGGFGCCGSTEGLWNVWQWHLPASQCV